MQIEKNISVKFCNIYLKIISLNIQYSPNPHQYLNFLSRYKYERVHTFGLPVSVIIMTTGHYNYSLKDII